MEKEFNIKSVKGDFRIAIKNGIEAVALKYCIMLGDDATQIQKNFETILEHIEYRIDKDSWLKVKDGNNYYPNNIENNGQAIMDLVEEFMKRLNDFFIQSNE